MAGVLAGVSDYQALVSQSVNPFFASIKIDNSLNKLLLNEQE